VAQALGPLVVGPPRVAWLLSSPVDRAQLLRARCLSVVALAAAVGAATAALLTVAAGGGAPVRSTAAGGLVGVVVVAAAVVAQSRPDPRATVSRTAAVLVAVVVAGLAALVGSVRAGAVVVFPAVPDVAVSGGVAVLAAGALVALGAALRSLGRLTRSALTSAAPVVAALSAGMWAMDTSLLPGVVAERGLLRRAVVRSRRHPPGRWRALLAAERHRAARARGAQGWAAGLLVVPYAVGLVGPVPVVAVVRLACCCLVAGRFAGGLRAVGSSAALRRSLGGADRPLLAVHLVVPAAVATAWGLATAAAGGSVAAAAVAPVGAVVVAARAATRRPPSGTSTLLDTPLGTLPVDSLRELARGPAVFAMFAALTLVLG